MAVRTFIGKVDPVKQSYGKYEESDFRVEYEGATLSVWEANYYHDDSDFYASVWDGESVKTVEYATTRGWTYLNSATVDATDEVRRAAGEYLGAIRAQQAADAANAEARVAKVGRRVRVVKGRKVPKGTEGVVFWVGPDRYGSSRWGTVYRVGFATDDGAKHFTAMSNVEAVDAETFTAADFPFDPMKVAFHRPGEHLAAAAIRIARLQGLAANGYASAR